MTRKRYALPSRAQVRAVDLVTPDGIASRLEVKSHTVATWAKRYPRDFPKPWLVLSRVPVYAWPEIESWARLHGRTLEVRRGEVTAEDLALAVQLLDQVRAQLAREVRECADAVIELVSVIRRPAERETVRNGRGAFVSRDGRGNGRGEWDFYFLLSDQVRQLLSRFFSDSSSAPTPDQYAQSLGIDAVGLELDEVMSRWARACLLQIAATELERGKVPNFAYDAVTTYDVASIYGPDGALELARAWQAEREDFAELADFDSEPLPALTAEEIF